MTRLFTPAAAALALALGTTSALAQAPAPQAPAPVAAPPVLRPSSAPPPSTVAPAAATSAASPAAARAATAPLTPPPAVGAPVDSVRPAGPAAVRTPPAGAAAQCRDGSYVASPGDCASRQGVLVAMPRSASPPPARPATPAPAALRVAVPSAQPPAGATMQCKDGTYLFGPAADGRCGANGGLAAVLVTPRPTPAPPAQPRRP